MAASGSRSAWRGALVGIEPIVRATRRTATIGRWASSCSSTSTASSIAAPIPSRASPRSLPIARPVATTSSTSPTTRCTTGPTTRRGSRRWAAPVSPETVVSSARATAAYLRDHDPGIRRVLVLGAGGLERELRDEGYDVVTAAAAATRMSQESIDGFVAAGRPDAVVVGLDPNLTYARLAVANDSIRAGAHFIATNRDPVYPTERGLRPGRRLDRHRPRVRDRGRARCRSASPRRTSSRRPRTRSVASRPRRS